MRLVGLLVIAAIAAWCAPVHAQPTGDAVALLPLDADKRLEIYGQPVAHEVGSALEQGGIEVVVVGAKMAVPERALLIVDGTIKGTKGEVTLAVRLRDPKTGAVLDTLHASAKELTAIDRAAHELSALVVPAVQKHLAQIKAKPVEVAHAVPKDDAKPAPPPPLPAMLVAVTGARSGEVALRDALIPAIASWSEQHHRAATPTDIAHLARAVAPKAVAGVNAEMAISFEVLGYTTRMQGEVPLGYARVHVRISDRDHVAFDRVVVTDSVVGDRKLSPPALAGRVARSVLDIVEPHLRRAIPAWHGGG